MGHLHYETSAEESDLIQLKLLLQSLATKTAFSIWTVTNCPVSDITHMTVTLFKGPIKSTLFVCLLACF